MPFVRLKPLKEYPFYVRWFFRRQARKIRPDACPVVVMGTTAGAFFGLLFLLGLFQRKRFPVCVDFNAYNLLQAMGSTAKAEEVSHCRESELYSDRNGLRWIMPKP